MSDIEPWIESGASSDVVECVLAARRERPRDEVIESCAALVAAGGLGIAAAAAAKGAPLAGGSGLVGSSSAAGVLGLFKWGAGGFLAATVFVTGAHVATRSSSPGDTNAPVRAAPVSQPVPESPAVAPVYPSLDTLPTSAPPAQPAAPTPGNAASSVKSSAQAPPSNVSPDEQFAEELALIDRVRASVDARNPALASTLLAEHERRFGKTAQLSPEARYLRLEVLVATGRLDEARGLAREMLARDSAGPHAARARAVLEEK